MQIRNFNSPSFNGCIAATSTMGGAQRETICRFNDFLRSKPDVIKDTEQLNIDIILTQGVREYKPLIRAAIFDRASKKSFPGQVITLTTTTNLSYEKNFFNKIVELIEKIKDGEVKKPCYNDDYANSGYYRFCGLDESSAKRVENIDKTDKKQELDKIFEDYFEKVDEADVIYEI